jgi:hypothetical protein
MTQCPVPESCQTQTTFKRFPEEANKGAGGRSVGNMKETSKAPKHPELATVIKYSLPPLSMSYIQGPVDA